MGTPTLSATGTWGYAASGSVTPSLAAHAVGDMLIARVSYKSSAIATCAASTATSGWQKVGEFHDGTTNSGNGTGSVAVAAFWKVATATSGEAPTIDFSQTVTQVGAEARAYALGAGDTAWFTPVGDGGPDTTADTSKSMTIQSHVSITAGDLVDFFMGIRDDCTMTVPTFTQTGATLAAVVESPAAAGIDTSGADGAYDGGYRTVSSGTSSAAAVVTGTLNTSETGAAWTTRLRSFASEEHSGTAVLTGGGVAVLAGAKTGSASPVLTGGGVAVLAVQKGASSAPALTGGGIAALVSATERTAAPVLTGAGIATLVGGSDRSGVAVLTGGGVAVLVGVAAEEHSGSAVLTGGGILTVASSTDRSSSPILTGGGVAVLAGLADRAGSAVLTGGGILVLEPATGRSSAPVLTGGGVIVLGAQGGRAGVAVLTGGGVAVLEQATARGGTAVLTGGGIVVIVGQGSGGGEDHSGTAVLTGGGVAALIGQKEAAAALVLTGGGVIVPAWATERTAALLATGGGQLVLLGGSERAGAVVLTGGGRVTLEGVPVAPAPPFSALRPGQAAIGSSAPTGTIGAGAVLVGRIGGSQSEGSME